jgi:hypothetical protein
LKDESGQKCLEFVLNVELELNRINHWLFDILNDRLIRVIASVPTILVSVLNIDVELNKTLNQVQVGIHLQRIAVILKLK